MNISRGIFTVLAMLVMSNQGFADIYKTKDAEGNTVYTDVPTQGAKEVDVQPTNTADAPPDIPHKTSPQPASRQSGAAGAAGASQQAQDDGVTIIGGGAYNERVERAAEEHRREEARDKVEHHGEGENAEPLRRTPPAMQPHRSGGRR